jgi:hypothetical protein
VAAQVDLLHKLVVLVEAQQQQVVFPTQAHLAQLQTQLVMPQAVALLLLVLLEFHQVAEQELQLPQVHKLVLLVVVD